MKRNKKEIFILVILFLYQTFIYLISKLSPFNYHLLKSSFDNKIPFVPIFILFYVSWYAMLFIIPYWFIKKNNKNLFYKYVVSLFISITVCGLIFLLYPTTVERPDIVVNSLSTLLLKSVYVLDTPAINCLPSIHCLSCFLFIIYSFLNIELKFIQKTGVTIWSVLVILSTLLIKQHVVIDVVMSLVIAGIICILVEKTNIWKKVMIKEN